MDDADVAHRVRITAPRVCGASTSCKPYGNPWTSVWAYGGQDPSSEPSFYHNQAILADGFKHGKLYALCAIETDDMHERGANQDICARWEPVLCMTTYDGELTEIVWTLPRTRRRGLASALLYM